MIGQQVALRLTENKKRLSVLHERGAIRADGAYHIQFDSQDFAFSPGKVIHVPQNVAECLIAQQPLMGGTKRKMIVDGETVEYLSALDAGWTPVLDVVETWAAGEESPSAKAARATACTICTDKFETVEQLIAHLGTHVAKTEPVPAQAGKGR